MTIRVDFFESSFDFNSRNRFDLTRFSIPILEINLSRLSNQVDSNCQDSSRLIDPNSINRPNAISLVKIDYLDRVANLESKINPKN